ncbi:hypothetical protein BC937DRAFT_92980 [Endogone sp. FLAS-F59071]|nr:hypothetical protein BC937DRAFT_92980 [Endogone sp. FLAS-F59071]|eukprot:RUS15035.1 hypothetical protein BC937DRAFT_92980 [Endogone sp. FLAS-F59071]
MFIPLTVAVRKYKQRKSILTVDDDDDESDDDKENEWQDYPSSVAQKKLLLPKRVAVPKKVAAPKKPVERRVLPSRRSHARNFRTHVQISKQTGTGESRWQRKCFWVFSFEGTR